MANQWTSPSQNCGVGQAYFQKLFKSSISNFCHIPGSPFTSGDPFLSQRRKLDRGSGGWPEWVTSARNLGVLTTPLGKAMSLLWANLSTVASKLGGKGHFTPHGSLRPPFSVDKLSTQHSVR